MYLEWIKTAFTHFSPLSLSIVLTQLNRWCANLFDMIVHVMAILAALWLIPMGCIPMSPPMSLSLSWHWLWSLRLVPLCWYTTDWQPGGLELDNHCSYDRHCQYKSPFVCCSVCLSCWLAARRGTEHADMLEQYYGKLHNHCLKAYSKITVYN